MDCRAQRSVASYTIPADVERLQWDPHLPFNLYAALEDGTVACIDARNTSALAYCYTAHEETVSSLSFSAGVRGMMSTASVDGTVKIWDVHTSVDTNEETGARQSPRPKLVAYKSMQVGKLFACEYYHRGVPFTLACGGDEGKVAVWESDELSTIREYFKDRSLSQQATVGVGVGGVTANGVGDLSVPMPVELPTIMSTSVVDAHTVDGEAANAAKKKKKGKKKKAGVEFGVSAGVSNVEEDPDVGSERVVVPLQEATGIGASESVPILSSGEKKKSKKKKQKKSGLLVEAEGVS